MKKIIFVYLVFLAVILSSATGSTPVLDSDGDEVRAGVAYKIYSTRLYPGFVSTALTLGRTGNKLCPLDVVLAEFNQCLGRPCGLPLTFHPEEGNLVSLYEDLNIKFDAITVCLESTVWKVVSNESSVDGDYVSSGGVVGNPLSSSWFRIQSAGNTVGGVNVYELVYCPRNLTTYTCWSIGLAADNDQRLFVQKHDPSPFYFVIGKVKTTLSSVV